MRVVSRIDPTGLFIEDVLLDDGDPLPGDCIPQRAPEGLHTPRWSGTRWVDAAPPTLGDVKAAKEGELRDAANAWYVSSIRPFEGGVVVAKYGRGGLTALNAEERAVFDEMNANYTRLKSLIGQVRAASTVAEVQAVRW